MTATRTRALGRRGLWVTTASRHSPSYGVPGTELFDDAGHRYLDFLCGLAVTGLGHAHPRVAAAVAEQASTLIHVSNLFVTEPQLEVAERLDRLVRSGTGSEANPAGGTGRILFQNSGAEANEAALKLVRKFHGRGRHGVLSAFRSFHGRTLATLAATGQPEKHEPFQPLPEGFRHAAWNDVAAFEAALATRRSGPFCSNPSRARAGSTRPTEGFLRGHPAVMRRTGPPAGHGRGPDRPGTDRGEWFGFHHAGIRPRCGDGGQGTRQRDPHWGCMGYHGGGRRLRALVTTVPRLPASRWPPPAAREVLRVMEEIDAPRLARERGVRS